MKDFKLNRGSVGDLINLVKNLVLDGKTYRISFIEWKDKRGLPANNQQHLWYGQIAKQLGDVTALEVKGSCKEMFAVPIILRCKKHGDKINYVLNKLEYFRHNHENRTKLMQCISITSLFNTKQSKEYMDAMIYYYNSNGIRIKYKDG